MAPPKTTIVLHKELCMLACPSSLIPNDPIILVMMLSLSFVLARAFHAILERRHPSPWYVRIFRVGILWSTLIVLLFPMVDLLDALVTARIGTPTTATVINRSVDSNIRVFHSTRLDLQYAVTSATEPPCQVIRTHETVSVAMYEAHPVGSSIRVRYLPYAITVAHPEGSVEVYWSAPLILYGMLGIVGVACAVNPVTQRVRR
jgi:hypothetical protein